MDQLPISLVSNDLKYAMSSLKIKTFQRAREYYYTKKQAVESGQIQIQELVGVGDKLEKIKKYMQKYNTIRENVWRKIQQCRINDSDDEEGNNIVIEPYQIPEREIYIPRYQDSSDQSQPEEVVGQLQQAQKQQREEKKEHNFNNSSSSNFSMVSFDFDLKNKVPPVFKEEWDRTQILSSKKQHRSQQNEAESSIIKPKNLFEKTMVDSSIVQIYGDKSVGKTALLLYFCQKYAQSSNRKIYFINCAGGVTYKRFERLQQKCQNLQYRDSYILDHVLAVCKSAASDPNTGCIAVDSLTNLLMEEEKTLIFLIKIFKIFSYMLKKGCKVILTNYKQQQFDMKEDENLTNHYSYYCAVTSEFLTYKYFLKKKSRKNKVLVKMCRGGFVEADFDICVDGVGNLEVKEGEREI